MSWVTVIWSMTAAACLTLAAVHGFIWLKERAAWLNLWFAVTATLIAVFGGFELLLMRAQTTTDYSVLHRWAHVPIGLAIIGLVGFVRLYFRTGRAGLFWLVIGLRVLVLILDFVSPASFNFREITALRQFEFLGESVAVPIGVPTPWARLGEGSVLLALIFVADATISLRRRGNARERRRAALVGGSVMACIGAAMVNAILVHTGLFPMPYCVSFFFGLITVAMAYELGHDALHAGQLARDLRESEHRVSLAAAAANLGLWTWDLVRDDIWVSQNARELFGVEASEQVDFKRFLQILHPDDRESVTHAVAKAMNGDGDYECEYRVVIPGQPARWLAARGRLEFDAQRKPLLLRGVSIDITERKQSEERLRESEGRFRIVADAAPVLLWMSGTDKLCTFFNQPWLDFTGRTLEQELGNGWADGVHAGDLQRCLKIYHAAFDAQQQFEMEYRLRRHDGEYRWILDHGVPRYDAQGNFSGYIGACADVTARKRAEERFRLAVEASPSAIIIVNHEGKIQLVNALTEKLFGYDQGELVGQPVEVLVPERYRGGHPGHRAGFIAAPQVRPMGAGRELFARRKDSTEFPVEIGLNPFQTEQGVLVLSTIVDITERRRAEAETQELRHELAHSGRVNLLGQLASALAHELSQPLGAILRNAEAAELMLQHSAPDLEELRAIITDIHHDNKRAGNVIDRLRSLLKRRTLEPRPADPAGLIAEVVALVRVDAVARRVMVECFVPDRLPEVLGDRVHLQQVLLNLILNAMDAVNESANRERSVSIAARLNEAGMVEVAVSDNGHGIAAETLERVFEPFFTTKTHGMGMGLPISKTIIEAHRGRIWAENRAEGGACFRFTVPVVRGDWRVVGDE